MSFSIQTNVNSLIAQENLRVNSNFQSQTIQRLTSGFRINNSGDDAAGLAIANQFRNDTAELMQGVRNANDGISAMQIIDGGMNNIAKMLDRLRTLAAQSSSDTFTGDRNVLNSEFQSLITEIDRQAQSIGLDTNGKFARTLSVFVGGGRATGTGAISTTNGEIIMDLTRSSVDTRSLGLKGLQVIGGTADLGSGSATHTVSQILADGSNTTAAAGFTDLYFSGPGFADGSKIKVSANLSGVTDLTSLAAAVNTAIANAANAGTQAATQFKNAGLVASVHTSADGSQQLAFTSATSAFQVEAGDVMANALLGNFQAGTTGKSVATTVVGAATASGATAFVPSGVTVRISGGGLDTAQDITFDSTSVTSALAITDLTNKIATNNALKAAGITVSGAAGGALTFTGARGEKLNVQTTGDMANVLGMGTFLKGAGSTADYSTMTAGSAYDNTNAYGVAKFEFSVNGGASNGNVVSVNLDAGDATAAQNAATSDSDQSAKTLTLQLDTGGIVTVGALGTNAIASAAAINANVGASALVTASVNSSGFLVITSKTFGAHTLTIGGTTTLAGITGAYKGNSRTAGDLVNALNAGIAVDPELSKAGLSASKSLANVLTISSSNNTFFRLNTGGTAASADSGFGAAGTANFAGLTINGSNLSVLDANGSTQTTAINFAALQYGNDDQAITISANDSNGVLQTKTITLQNDGSARNGRSIDEVLHYINAQLQQSNNATLSKIVAVKENDGLGNEQINFLSALPNFSVGVGNSANSDGLNAGVATSKSSALLGSGANVSIESESGALQAVGAVASAISLLGTAQAAVGKGQNQLNYAIGLAQSQISNFSAAESRIRDADVAMEAANLTKAQVLQQASMAAMAQANSAPQAVLSLLRGQ
jgi:flagellin